MIFMIVCLAIFVNYEVNSEETFRYEKLHNFGLGRRVIPNYRRLNPMQYHQNNNEHPEHSEQLFKKKPAFYIRPPYRNVYQGTRRKGDRRVYNEKFSHKAESSAFTMSANAVLDCIITHMAVETVSNIPIIYRGGAGYRYFMVVVKSDPGVEISGRVRAYCKNVTQEQ